MNEDCRIFCLRILDEHNTKTSFDILKHWGEKGTSPIDLVVFRKSVTKWVYHNNRIALSSCKDVKSVPLTLSLNEIADSKLTAVFMDSLAFLFRFGRLWVWNTHLPEWFFQCLKTTFWPL